MHTDEENDIKFDYFLQKLNEFLESFISSEFFLGYDWKIREDDIDIFFSSSREKILVIRIVNINPGIYWLNIQNNIFKYDLILGIDKYYEIIYLLVRILEKKIFDKKPEIEFSIFIDLLKDKVKKVK